MEHPEITDSDLAQRLQSGDESAFDVLLERHKRPVLNFVYRLFGDEAEAEDVAQEVFIRVYQKIKSYRPAEKFTTWLFAIARNFCLDRLRHRQRHPTAPLESAPEPSAVSRDVQMREIGSTIAAAIQQLPEDQRTAIVLAEYHGQSHAEIAGIMGCSEKAVESRLYRAKIALRQQLAHLLD